MSAPTKENILSVMKSFADFFNHMLQTKGFNLQEFVKFMEPRFKAADYRDTDKSITGGDILILTEIGAGDFVASSAAIREIRRIYHAAHITLVVHPRAFELAECCPYVDELILNPQKVPNYNPFDFYRLNLKILPELLRRRFDICFSFSIHPHTPLLMYMSGAKIRVTPIDDEDMETFKRTNNLMRYLMRLSTHLFPSNTYGSHRADRFLSTLENFLHLPITNRKTEIWFTPADAAFARTSLKNLPAAIYSLSMGCATTKINHYPPEKYAKLLEMILRKEPATTFVILGGGQDDLNSAELLKNTLPKVYAKNILDLTNKTTFRQSAAILKLCDLHIGNDTGTIHIAAAVGCPVLNPIPFAADLPMMNTTCPKRWHPYGVPSVRVQPKKALPECKAAPTHRGCAATVPHCITQIKPETLFKGFQLLKERAAKKIDEPLYIH